MCTALAFQVDTPIVLGVLKGQAISKEQGYTELYSERSRGLFSCIRMLEDVKNLLWASSTQLSANSFKMRCLYTLLGQSLRKVIEPKLQECRVLGLQNRLEHCNLSTFRKKNQSSGYMCLSSLLVPKEKRWGALSHAMSSLVIQTRPQALRLQRGSQD